MSTWTNTVTTSTGGNVSLNIQGGYNNVSRDGASLSFTYGLRMSQSTDYWSSNSFCAFNSGTRYWAKASGTQSGGKGVWYYANYAYNSTTTTDTTPWSYSTTLSSANSGYITLSLGAGWNAYTPSNGLTYTFNVPYPAAASYSVKYSGNGGSNVPGTQTKYKGYSLTLSSTVPTRSGYTFTGWYGTDGWSYSAGGTMPSDRNYEVTLTAQWSANNPIFTAPSLTSTETSISWGSFSIDKSSNVYYQVDSTSGSWTSIGTSTTTGSSGTVSGLTAGTSHTVYFKAISTENNLETVHSSAISTKDWPYITSINSSTINIGSTQIINLYNPLNRSVTITASSSAHSTSVSTTSASVSLAIPLTMANDVSNDTTHTGSISYQSSYSGHTSTKSGTINLTAAVGAPTIDSTKINQFLVLTDGRKFSWDGGTNYYSIEDATGGNNGERFLQTKSYLKYKLLSTENVFSSQYGSTIANNGYSVKINSKNATTAVLNSQYYEGETGGVIETTSGVVPSGAALLTQTNTYVITVSATDSRGFTSSFEKTFVTYAYNTPSLGTPQLIRDDGYGTATTLTVSGSWCNNLDGKHLSKEIRLYYKETSASSYSEYILYSDDGGASSVFTPLSGTYSLTSLSFDSGKSYECYVTATDAFLNTTSSTHGTLALGEPVFMIDTEQQGVGVNCFPDGDGLYVNGDIHTSDTIKGKIINGYSGYVTSATSDLSSYWFKIWDATITERQYNDWSCTLQLNNNYDDKWGQIGFGIRQNGANSGGAYNFGVNLKRISGNMALSYMRLYYNNSTGECSLWANAQARYGTVNYQVISKTERTSAETEPIGTFYSGSYSEAQTLPSSDYIEMTDITALTAAYPVGAVYLSYESTSPAALFGGTWERLSGGFIYGCVDSSGTGNGTGTSSGSVTLTAAQSGLRSHNHGLGGHTHSVSGNAWGNFYLRHGASSGTQIAAAGSWTSVENSVGEYWNNGFATSTYGHYIDRVNLNLGFTNVSVGSPTTASDSVTATSATESHSHTIPYIAVFAWRRTA